MLMHADDVIEVGLDSWAGRSWHRARVVKVCRRRVLVVWLDSALGHRQGRCSYVPLSAVRLPRVS